MNMFYNETQKHSCHWLWKVLDKQIVAQNLHFFIPESLAIKKLLRRDKNIMGTLDTGEDSYFSTLERIKVLEPLYNHSMLKRKSELTKQYPVRVSSYPLSILLKLIRRADMNQVNLKEKVSVPSLDSLLLHYKKNYMNLNITVSSTI